MNFEVNRADSESYLEQNTPESFSSTTERVSAYITIYKSLTGDALSVMNANKMVQLSNVLLLEMVERVRALDGKSSHKPAKVVTNAQNTRASWHTIQSLNVTLSNHVMRISELHILKDEVRKHYVLFSSLRSRSSLTALRPSCRF